MAINNALASLSVKDLRASVLWYQALLGRPADSNPMPEVAEWKFARGGWLQVYQNEERAGAGSVTLAVSDVDEQIVALKRIGIDPGRIIDGPKVKVVMIRDPDGNSIAFAQAKDGSIAQ